MLRFIVEKTVTGQQEELKERTIGVEVFGRNPNYDTNSDPVVRFSAGEIRKRIAQYYRDKPDKSPVEIDLPLGTYIPVFYRIDSPVEPKMQTQERSSPPPGSLPKAEEQATGHHIMAPHNSAFTFFAVTLIVLVAGGVVGYLYRSKPTPADLVWAPLLKDSRPVLISAGRPHKDTEILDTAGMSIKDRIIEPDYRVSLATASAMARIAGYLQSHNKLFVIREAYSQKLSDLHDQPVVLLNANDNKWTLQLMKSLRFQFQSVGDLSYISDAQNPSNRSWNVDFLQPYLQQTSDYAIVSKFHSSTTGGPIIVVAGISSTGTEAASEFIITPDSMKKLQKLAPGNWDKNGDFEAVLKVEVVGGNYGAVTIIGSQFW